MSFCEDHQQEMRQSTYEGKEHTFYCPTKGCPNRWDSTTGNYFKVQPRQPRAGGRTAGPAGSGSSPPPRSGGAALTGTQLRLEVLKLAVQSEANRAQTQTTAPTAVEIATQMMKFIDPVVAPAAPATMPQPQPPPRRPAPTGQADETYPW